MGLSRISWGRSYNERWWDLWGYPTAQGDKDPIRVGYVPTSSEDQLFYKSQTLPHVSFFLVSPRPVQREPVALMKQQIETKGEKEDVVTATIYSWFVSKVLCCRHHRRRRPALALAGRASCTFAERRWLFHSSLLASLKINWQPQSKYFTVVLRFP